MALIKVSKLTVLLSSFQWSVLIIKGYWMKYCYRLRALHWGGSPDSGLAGGSHWPRVQPEDQGQPQALGLHRLSRLHLRAGQRCLRPGEDVGQAAELHLPVSPGHQEADEEIRAECPSLSVHLPEPLSEIFIWPGVSADLRFVTFFKGIPL